MAPPSSRESRGFRFGLKPLLLGVVPLSLAAAALGNPTGKSTAAVATSTLAALLTLIVAALLDARRRPIWCGALIFSAGYWLVLLFADNRAVDSLATEQLNRWLLLQRSPQSWYERDSGAGFLSTAFCGNNFDPRNAGPGEDPAESFYSVVKFTRSFKYSVRCLWAWLFGACGALLALLLQRRNFHVRTRLSRTAQAKEVEPRPAAWARILYLGLICLAILGGGVYALSQNSVLSTPLIFSAAGISALVAALIARFGRPHRRPICTCYAVYCGGYFLFMCFTICGTQNNLAGTLFELTTMQSALVRFHDARFPDELQLSEQMQGGRVPPFCFLGHSVMAISAGFLGAIGAQCVVNLNSRRRRSSAAVYEGAHDGRK